MTNIELSKSYVIKASKRLAILKVLFESEDYSDVVRESQEIVELAQKAMLRQIGIDPPKWHDVSGLLLRYKERFPSDIQDVLEELSEISKWLREEREMAFYGDIDFIPTEEYTKEDAIRAMSGAKKVIDTALRFIEIE